jgi:hypothetical protein
MIDVNKLIKDCIAAATNAAQADITAVSGFARSQFLAIAQNAAGIVADRLAGQLTDQEVDLLLERMPKLVQATVNTLQGLAVITIEKVWNAVAKTVQEAVKAGIKGAI